MTKFSELAGYLDLPRAAGLALSPDGSRLVVGVSVPEGKKTEFTGSLWEVDPAGERPARRLTRGKEGESGPAFTREGDLLFVSKRPDPASEEEAKPALWLQPAAGGDARMIAALPGGVRQAVVAADAGTIVLGSSVLPSATSVEHDAELRKARKEGAVSAILHEGYPVRFWDHDLGPDRTRLFLGGEGDWKDLTADAGAALTDEASWDISRDGTTVAAAWTVPEAGGAHRQTIVLIDVATGERRALADDPGHEYDSPRFSPDGTQVAFVARRRSTPEDPGDVWLALAPVSGGEIRALTPEWDRWPGGPRWTPDGAALVVAADDLGHCPLWRVDVATGVVVRLTETGAFSDPVVSPDGRWVYALRSAVDSPPRPVRVALDGSGVEFLRGLEPPELPGTLDEVTTTAADGSPLRAWIALPHNASADEPAPLLLWIHGGPLNSWNAWQWRWNPWLAVARGYAVLLPDPALSTGYGIEFIRRGWGAWGGTPFTDLMTVTDAAEQRPDIDATRTAAMGGSFGGYMANWVAGHTTRFSAIVTHASLWALDQFGGTTDESSYWHRELTPEMAEANSPHRFADDITTPMLVIHGDKDYRVPVGEALRLWWDLLSRAKGEDGTSPHKFLYFPDENHWVLTPNHAKLWYETVFAFLAQHVLGEAWQRPELLG
ncbi:S9 family peptidase [Amycolatopsis acidicola]|uniref:S9 family peptidase n=1 Tax=Amycolatopsis acidicola TaxID=2596893 RepID=A0A5N0UT87_9PSEU|nr:prolyl oligopeptidase family serine peptidase [Amycolatopsis acidicola]KAA9154328.1 S9 family peptidase [Amycolatopsis acidicola]